MSQLVVVSRDRHSAKRWRRPEGFGFAAGDAVVPALGSELSKLAPAMPLAFVEQSGQFELMAILSLTPGKNMFVGPDGRWLAGHVPAWYRSYPFRLLRAEETNEPVLCVDEDSKLVVDSAAAGESFFDADGAPSPALKAILDYLIDLDRIRKATQLAISALAGAGVIQPWPITVNTAEGEKPVTGLHRIDEAALNALDDEGFLRLRKVSALAVAYAQMLSIGQLAVFADLARLQAQLARTAAVAAPARSFDSLLQMLPNEIVRFE